MVSHSLIIWDLGTLGEWVPPSQNTWLPGFSPFPGQWTFLSLWHSRHHWGMEKQMLRLAQCLLKQPPDFVQDPGGGVGTTGNLLVCKLQRPWEKHSIWTGVQSADPNGYPWLGEGVP